MCGSEPCRHEREFAGTQRDAIRSFIAAIKAEVAAEGEVAQLRATLAKVAAIVADPHAALVVDRVRAVLEES
jgi:hypothetical protein